MSVPVEVGELATALADFGAGYLLTASAAGRVKAVSVRPELVEGVLVMTSPGRGSVGNAAANPQVTVLWPPIEAGAMSLIVDGAAEVVGDDVRVRPTGAVRHKSAG
ncbi:MAG: pyridoxamine 5'-phosphate oxidase family protein [Nocardioides sp.]